MLQAQVREWRSETLWSTHEIVISTCIDKKWQKELHIGGTPSFNAPLMLRLRWVNLSPYLQLPTCIEAVAKDLNLEVSPVHSLKKSRRNYLLQIGRSWITLSWIQRFTTTSFCWSPWQDDHVHIASIVTECGGTTRSNYYKSDPPGRNAWEETWNLLYDEQRNYHLHMRRQTNDIKNYVELGHRFWMLHWLPGLS